eukprot:366000-Chlamydomonas_euryale.AAC.7
MYLRCGLLLRYAAGLRPLLGGTLSGAAVGTTRSTIAVAASESCMPSRGYLTAHEKEGKVMHPDLLNESVVKTQYAVRGELYLRGEQLRQAGKEIIFTNGTHSIGAWSLGCHVVMD